jgi:hypothetical protein
MSTTHTYTYKYPFESALLENPTEPTMRWATSLDGTSDDLFFAASCGVRRSSASA